MSSKTEVHVRVDEVTEEKSRNRVSIEVSSETAIESIVLAYRQDGELVELAERSAPAAAELQGELE